MASSDLSDELSCSICLSLYTDPVFLRCGHNFCRSCIVRVLDAQEDAGVYSCPDCRAEYLQLPRLKKNRKLRNIVERFLSTQPEMEETGIFCTYCTKSPVPAVKSCLQCETSLCDDHLTAHNKTVDHVVTEPTDSFGNKKCSTHKKVLEYYCPQDAACLCVSCCLVGKHRGHQVELLDEASEKKNKKLRTHLDGLNAQKAELLKRVQNLHDHKKTIEKKTSDRKKTISKLFMVIKKQLEMAEKKVQSEISRQKDKIVSQMSHLIKELEIKEDHLSRKMHHVEEMCRVTDPIRLLQERDITGSRDGGDEDTGEDGGEVKYEDDVDETADSLDEDLIFLTLHRSLRDIIINVNSELGFQVPDILLDEDTAHTCVELSGDLKTATASQEEEDRPEMVPDSEEQDRPESPGRFLMYSQVLSRCGFSSGKQYWEVKWNRLGGCDIGMSYPSIERDGDGSGIGENDKSWCLILEDAEYSVSHDSISETLRTKPTCPSIGVFLDYEAGRLSYYELCDPIRHLHTFTASFTEPLHVCLYVYDAASVTLIS